MTNHPLEAANELLNEEAYNAASKTQVNNMRKKTARLRKEELDYVKQIMSTIYGRKWMYNLLTSTCKTFGNPIVPNETHYTYFNLGERNIGMKLFQDINDAAPQEYINMMQEAKTNA